MKHINYSVIIIFLGLFISCNGNQLTFEDQNDVKIEHRSVNYKSDRLKIDNEHSVLVTYAFSEGQLLHLNYELVAKADGDKTQVLDFRNQDYLNGQIVLFNSVQSDGSYYENYKANLDNVSYGCTCKSLNGPTDADDCQLRSYTNLKYCDGILCDACSLLVSFLPVDIEMITTESSLIILPPNF